MILTLGCGSGGDDTPGREDQTPPPSDATAIRSIDFSQNGELQTLIRQLGSGSIATRDILYGDVTGDRREEAAVPIDSGGTLGNVAYAVFTLRSGAPSLILTRTLDRSSGGGLVMAVEDGKLIETSGQFGAEDPFCCPSQLRKTTFRWDGSRLQVEREEVIANPAGRPKQ
jgi:hypothetical protein